MFLLIKPIKLQKLLLTTTKIGLHKTGLFILQLTQNALTITLKPAMRQHHGAAAASHGQKIRHP